MVMSSLVFDGYSLLHQTTLFELVAVDEGAAETTLLVWGQTLCEICINFVR